jgi:glycosyltransferase involved in cell wall biosynthesis
MSKPPPTPTRPLRIALLGSRGIPGRYGGYETLVEELGARLVARGHRVLAYARRHVVPAGTRVHRGVEVVVLPTVRHKYLDTPVHTFLSCLDAARRELDAALLVNSANALFLPLLGQAGIPTALHVDGIERRRAKWGPLGRAVYALSERLACVLPAAMVSDAMVIRNHYLERYGTPSVPIAYGVLPPDDPGTETLAALGLEPRRYLLYVSRFEPENNPHRVAAEYRAVPGDLPLVMVGSAPYAGAFIRSFTGDADPRIRFPGAIYGTGYRQLLAHAFAYIHATEVGGVHPALVEAMGYGNCVVVNDTPENREAAGHPARFFRVAEPGSLAAALTALVDAPEEARRLGELAGALARRRYDWERITDRYEALFAALAAGRAGAFAANAKDLDDPLPSPIPKIGERPSLLPAERT